MQGKDKSLMSRLLYDHRLGVILGREIFGELSVAHQMGDMLPCIGAGAYPKMLFRYGIAPFDVVHLIQNDHALRHGGSGALQALKC